MQYAVLLAANGKLDCKNAHIDYFSNKAQDNMAGSVLLLAHQFQNADVSVSPKSNLKNNPWYQKNTKYFLIVLHL